MPEPRTFTVEMPSQPLGANEKRRARHWSIQWRDTTTFRDGFALLAKDQHRGPPMQQARVDITLVRTRGQVPLDPDNIYSRAKPCLDALIQAGVISDDSAEHIELHMHQGRGAARATRMTVTERLTPAAVAVCDEEQEQNQEV
jgi:hypothetical protein